MRSPMHSHQDLVTVLFSALARLYRPAPNLGQVESPKIVRKEGIGQKQTFEIWLDWTIMTARSGHPNRERLLIPLILGTADDLCIRVS